MNNSALVRGSMRTYWRLCKNKLQSIQVGMSTPSLRDQSLMYKRLAMSLDAGIPLLRALQQIAEEKQTTSTGAVLRKVASFVEEGVSLSRALERGGYPLPSLSRHIVAIGETSGTLAFNLVYLAQFLKDRLALRTQVRQALVYPAIILCATSGIALFLVVGILPKIVPIFASMHGTLPISTRILLMLSSVTANYWYVGIAFGAVFFVVAYYGLRHPYLRAKYHVLLLKLPIVSNFIRLYTIAMSCRTMAVLLDSDVRIGTALRVVSTSTAHSAYREAWSVVASEVERGSSLSAAVRFYPKLFPDVFVHMVEAGEATGKLQTTLQYLSVMYEDDMREATKRMTALLEPLLMLVMGLVVGFIAMAIITPIYGITEQLHP